MIVFQIISGILLVIIATIFLYVKFAPQFGGMPKGALLERIFNSKNYYNGKFQNLVETSMMGPNTTLLKNGLKFVKKIPGQQPESSVETVKFDKDAFLEPSQKLKGCWFGHSSLLLNIDGKIVLTDPVFSLRASPFKSFGIKSFGYTNIFTIEDLPEIDLVVLSHDHFDHLDYRTILNLVPKVKKFCVPLGVSVHLLNWGIQSDKILELDWWEDSTEIHELKLTATPSRHFSGRVGIKMDYTLWCSWVIENKNHKIFFCGDSGYSDHFKLIGEKFGPFELTMMECGQYNEGWPFIHMNPEEAVHAHIDLKGKIMLPIHWGKFKLSIHPWKEPIERVTKESERLNVKMLNLKPGEIFTLE